MYIFKVITKYYTDGKQWESDAFWFAGKDKSTAIQNALRHRKAVDKHYYDIIGFRIVDTDYLFCAEQYEANYNLD